MDILEKVRALGHEIQNDERYIIYNQAKNNNDADEQLQKLIGEFNLKRIELNQELGKTDKDQEKLKELDANIKEIYEQIMTNPNMMAFTLAKGDMDKLINNISKILVGAANGEDPDTVDLSACSGSCEGCSGCN